MFDPKAKDRTEKYILVGLVSGNPLGCENIKERLYPDYHVSVGNEEVTGNKMASEIRRLEMYNFQVIYL